jgi:phosphatidylglycerol:prolipoprotein diacylglycerol transferase
VLPYINLPDLRLGPLPIHFFGILVATGVLIGIWLARKRAKPMGVDPELLESFINWMLLGGFAGAHILDEIFYHPDELVARPWSIFLFWEGISSFGGFVGAAVGVFLWRKFKNGGKPILPYADLILSVFPVAWIFGRMGCASVHDHKGMATETPSLFTVAFPDGPHYDLGLLEMLYTIVLAAFIATLWKKKRAPGLYVGLTCALYAPVRFGLDFLRLDTGPTGDRRYLALTFAQWACVAMFAFGIAMLLRTRRPARSSAA